MSRFNLRCKPRISYCEPDDPDLDEYVYCDKCGDYVYEYCAIHGPLLVIPDDKVPSPSPFPPCVPRAALTVPRVFLHLALSDIPDAGIGVFTTLTLPRGVRFGPYKGDLVKYATSDYCWQIYDANRRPIHVVDAGDPDSSNWLRYVNCARHYSEQNLIAYQYQGQLYYRTIKLIPRFTELLVFYGGEFAHALGVSLKHYNKALPLFTHVPEEPVAKKPKLDEIQQTTRAVITSEDQDEKRSSPPKLDTEEKLIGAETLTVTKKKKLGKKKELKTPTNVINNENIQKDSRNRNSVGKETNATEHKTAINKYVNNKSSINSTGEILTCDIFKYTTVNVRNLNSHLKAHAATTRYSCDFCPYITIKKHELDKHIKIHTGDKPFSCNVCEKKFNHKGHLITHVRLHTGDKPYSCNVCEKKFNHKGNLITHVRLHTGDKPYSCNVCEKKFNHKGNLITHVRLHTGDKPYSCNVCENKFNHKVSLITHVRLHTGDKPYSCNVCEKKFNHKGNLITHVRLHTGDKPYSCNVCEKKFNHKGNLITHVRLHTGDKPYSCNVCEKKFNQKGQLIIHVRKHTGDKPFL